MFWLACGAWGGASLAGLGAGALAAGWGYAVERTALKLITYLCLLVALEVSGATLWGVQLSNS